VLPAVTVTDSVLGRDSRCADPVGDARKRWVLDPEHPFQDLFHRLVRGGRPAGDSQGDGPIREPVGGLHQLACEWLREQGGTSGQWKGGESAVTHGAQQPWGGRCNEYEYDDMSLVLHDPSHCLLRP